MAEQDAPEYNQQATAAFKFVAGWLIMLAILAALNTTRIGHVAIYYSLVLMILFVLLTQAPRIAQYVAGIRAESPA
jgi:hypothetical protein